jgi:signal transduction histidine kinase
MTTYTLALPDPTSGENTTYSLAVHSIGAGSSGSQVVLDVAPGGRILTIGDGQTDLVDVNGSGHNNVGIQVVRVTPATDTTPATATLKFWKLAAFTNKVVPVVATKPPVRDISLISRLINDLTLFVGRLPRQFIDLFPYILFLLLALEAALLFRQATHELQEYRILQKLLVRARKVDEAKNVFIQLSSHYLRTPITTLLTGAELLGMGKDAVPASVGELQRIGERLRQTAELLIADTETIRKNPAVGNMEDEVSTKHLWRQAIIFVPVVLNLFVWIAFILLANRAGKFSFDQVNFAAEILVFIIRIHNRCDDAVPGPSH